MFQRLKGAFDSLEEQARPKPTSQSPHRRSSTTRKVAQSTNPASRRPQQPQHNGSDHSIAPSDPTGSDPDPSSFDPEKVVGVLDPPAQNSINGTSTGGPAPVQNSETKEDAKDSQKETSATMFEEGEPRDGQAQQLPEDVLNKLRRLSRLESKYQELLRAYRKAHARNSTIEPFESRLRESTPLTSINDPGAFVEYLSQLNIRGDMVMEELRTVSRDRDEIKGELDNAERRLREAFDEATQLRSTRHPQEDSDDGHKRIPDKNHRQDESASRPPKLETKTVQSGQGEKEIKSEDVFSVDDELPQLQSELSEQRKRISDLESQKETFARDLKFKENEFLASKSSNESLIAEARVRNNRLEALEKEVQELKSGYESTESKLKAKEMQVREALETRTALEDRLRTILKGSSDKGNEHGLSGPSPTEEQKAANSNDKQASTTKSKKSKKKKKKPTATSSVDHAPATASALKQDALVEGQSVQKEYMTQNGDDYLLLRSRLNECVAEIGKKNLEINQLKEKLKLHSETIEEVEHLREELLNIGSEHVDMKDKFKLLEADRNKIADINLAIDEELTQLRHESGSTPSTVDVIKSSNQVELDQARERIDDLQSHRDALEIHVRSLQTELHTVEVKSSEGEQYQAKLLCDLEAVKEKADTLQIEIITAKQLASSRWKDLSDLKTSVQKSRAEMASLRSELAEVRTSRDQLNAKVTIVRKLEIAESNLKNEIYSLKQTISDREDEIRTADEKAAQESIRRASAEETSRKSDRELHRCRSEQKGAESACDDALKRLQKVVSERDASMKKTSEMEAQVEQLNHDMGGLREDIELKTAQHASAQNLMNSVRDQAAEMGTQLKEANERAESLEAEVTDAHRLMNERGREGETMRRILADVESRADVRVKELQERMNIALQERDRAEDEVSTMGRRRARELEDLKNRLREAERDLRRLTDDKADLERAEKELQQCNAEDNRRAEQSAQELTEVRKAMSELRDALDEVERQSRELESEKTASQRALEDAQSKLEKLQKSSKTMADDLRTLRASRTRPPIPSASSSRSSLESSRTGHGTSPSRNNQESPKPPVAITGSIDFVYLKNVLLQFLEQRDRKYQAQLVPVLGMLLHFDKKDEQRWMTAISTS